MGIFVTFCRAGGGSKPTKCCVIYTFCVKSQNDKSTVYIIKISKSRPDGGGSVGPCSPGHGIPGGPYMVVLLHQSRIGARPHPISTRRQARADGVDRPPQRARPPPPAQAGGALCPRARGGSARTSDYAGSTSRRIIQQSAFCAIFHFTRGALCPGKLRKMWGLILYIFGGALCAVRASVRAPPSRPGARRAPGRGGSARSSERVERLASERAVLCSVAPHRGA